MPTRSWPLWLLTGLLIIGFPILNIIYFSAVLRSGVLPPEADSIGIPIINSFFATLLFLPFMLAMSWFCLRRYNPATRITAWRRDRPYRSSIATFILGGASLVLAVGAAADFRLWPWYEYLWSAYFAAMIFWLLGLRAAIIEQTADASAA